MLLPKTARAKQRTRGHREAHNTKDGDVVLFFLVILRIDRKSKVVAAMLVCEDISEQTRLGKELLWVNSSKSGQMVITINHKINQCAQLHLQQRPNYAPSESRYKREVDRKVANDRRADPPHLGDHRLATRDRGRSDQRLMGPKWSMSGTWRMMDSEPLL